MPHSGTNSKRRSPAGRTPARAAHSPSRSRARWRALVPRPRSPPRRRLRPSAPRCRQSPRASRSRLRIVFNRIPSAPRKEFCLRKHHSSKDRGGMHLLCASSAGARRRASQGLSTAGPTILGAPTDRGLSHRPPGRAEAPLWVTPPRRSRMVVRGWTHERRASPAHRLRERARIRPTNSWGEPSELPGNICG